MTDVRTQPDWIRVILSAFMMMWAGMFHVGAKSVWAAPDVAVSIKPLHSLVASVMDGIAEPHLILKGYGSPHAVQLRPSGAAALDNADVIFWIGPSLERFLIDPINNLGKDALHVALLDVPGIMTLPVREGGVWVGSPANNHQRLDKVSDPHIWLSPAHAKQMVRAIVDSLVQIDQKNSEIYRNNGTRLWVRIDNMVHDIAAKLESVADTPYIVFHDAFQYFEHAFGLSPVGSVVVNPDRPPGPRRLAEIRRVIMTTGAKCVFSEPQFESAIVAAVTEDTSAKHGILDPLGAGVSAGPDAYFQLMASNARAVASCLGQIRN